MRTVAYLGPEKTNTHLAALARFGRNVRYLHAPTVEDVFRLVEREKADFGVVPIENSLEGAVTYTLDRFIDFKQSPVRICGEIEEPIQHYFITHPTNTRTRSIRRIQVVYSHPQALAQCRRWLDKNYPRADLIETASTADAVDKILMNQKKALNKFRLWSSLECAAIGRKELVQGRGLRAVPIPIDRDNRTRFLVLSLKTPRKRRRSRTSLMFALKDKPGALHDVLVPFKRERINLTKIESRPSKRKAWEYRFFIDFEGHQDEPRVKKALKELEACTTECQVLGSYLVAGKSSSRKRG